MIRPLLHAWGRKKPVYTRSGVAMSTHDQKGIDGA